MSEGAILQPWQLADLPLHRLLKEGRSVSRDSCAQSVRIAVLGDCATQHYSMALASVLKLRRHWPELYEAEFDTIRQEVLDPASGLHRHQPRFVIFLNCVQALEEQLAARRDTETLAEKTVAGTVDAWDRVLERGGVTVLQHNLCLPIERPFGNLTTAASESFTRVVEEINLRLREESRRRRGVRMVDTEFQAAYFGKRQWLDERLWCQARQPLSPSFLPPLVKAVSDAILVELGVGVKCVILDLDNTIWGGVLGDDGLEGIEIGSSELGLVFRRMQSALAALRDRGVLLAVCTRNSEELARRAVAEHPDMVLRERDFAAFVANFGDKRENILAIRDRLGLALDSFVFLDDSPFERDLVRRSLPEVQVPELPEDPAQVLAAFACWNLFETADLTSEDRSRVDRYQDEARRRELRQGFSDLGAYLEGLGMEAEVHPFDDFSLPRVHQLVQRSNQFNVMTLRHSEADLQAFSRDAGYVTFTVRLEDRLGDSGIVVAVIAEVCGEDLVIDTWIMSCRVLGRRVEELTASLLVEQAKQRGCRRVLGQYRATDKNRLVADLYPRLGFCPIASENGIQRFVLEVESYEPEPSPIRVRP